MGYQTTIKCNVKKAFGLLKDLVVTATLSSKSNKGFDFATNSAKSPIVSTKPIKAIPVTKTLRDRSIQHSFLFMADDIAEPALYDTVTVDTVAWKVIAPYDSDGFLITVNVAKEQ